MKTFTKIISLLLIVFFTACEGPMGPPGLDGLDGQDGTDLLGTIFERTVDFTPENGYSVLFDFPADFEIYTSDVVMVYILWEQEQTNNGVLDVWRALPQTVFVDGGVIQYNFDYTVENFRIFVEETVGELYPSETDNQTFRIAVIPAAEYANKSIEISDYNAVEESLNIDSNSIIKLPVK